MSAFAVDASDVNFLQRSRRTVRIMDGAAGFSMSSKLVNFGPLDLTGLLAYYAHKNVFGLLNSLIDDMCKNPPTTNDFTLRRKRTVFNLTEKLSALLKVDGSDAVRFPGKSKTMMTGEATLKRLQELLGIYELSTDPDVIESVRASEERIRMGKTISADEFLRSVGLQG